MIKDEIIDLIRKGESENTEFKEKFDKEAVETAVAFANTKGGIIFIGVTDKARIKGIQIGRETMNDWANHISQIKPVSVRGRCLRRVA